jgi:glycosyltransferase involved in cell wall biosynthesis
LKILILSQFFAPEPHLKGLPFARELKARGHEVEVLTGFPNYPGGRVYQGHRIRPWQREYMEGILVNRVPLYPSHDSSPVRRILNYTSFALSAATLGALMTERPDVVHVYHPPPSIGLAAVVLKALKGVPFVYDVQDLWPDTVAATGMLSNPWALKAITKWCDFIYRQAGHVSVLSPGFKRVLTARGVPAEKITVIRNWCDEDASRSVEYDDAEAERLGMKGRFNIVFAGTMGKAQGLDSVLEAAEICAGRNPAIQFVFVGGGTERGRLEAASAGRGNVRFLPYRQSAEMPVLFGLADALLVHLKKDPLFEITIPSKTQAYLATGKPIIIGVAGDAADIVREAGAGLAVESENAGQIAEAALRLAGMGADRLKEMGAAGKDYYFRELSLRRGVDRFEEIFQGVGG